MRMAKSVLAGSLLLLVLGIVGAPAAFANAATFTVNDVVFTGSVSGTQAMLTVQCTNNAVCGNYFLGDVTLKGFSFTSASAGSASAGYVFANGGQNNDAVATGGGCNGKDSGGAVCWDAPSTLVQMNGTLFTFTANLVGGTTSGPLHVQATAYDNSSGIGKHGHKVFAISNDLNGSSITQTPEPGSMLLLGTGLLGIGGMIRRKLGA